VRTAVIQPKPAEFRSCEDRGAHLSISWMTAPVVIGIVVSRRGSSLGMPVIHTRQRLYRLVLRGSGRNILICRVERIELLQPVVRSILVFSRVTREC
jgi:hypothetical protein